MASVVSNRRGGWEIRESYTTSKGPRSRTLATFRELDETALALAASRAEAPFDRASVIRKAQRAGATVAASPVDEAARELLTRLNHGERLSRGLAGALLAQLERLDPPKLSHEALQAAEWAGESLEQRGRTLHDLLELADALPQERAGTPLKFPRMRAA
ncbi:MAG: hypothetical protein HYX29_11355 [Solirubrobacterales bacterium]|nr:hypothetical protein [Solirubrobacterales bacterium]